MNIKKILKGVLYLLTAFVGIILFSSLALTRNLILSIVDVKSLRLPADLDVPVLIGVGDMGELFTIDKVKEFYDLVPGSKKEFLVMKNSTHAKIPVESWMKAVDWLNKTYIPMSSK